MYSTSQAYKNAISSKYIKDRISGTMTLSNGDEFTIDDSNILDGSLSINNSSIDSDFNLGSVYTGEMNVTILDLGVLSRYSLYGAKIELSWFVTLANNTEEEIPLGVWYVNTPTRSKKTMALQCYDATTRFDKNLIESTTGDAYTLLSYICNIVGVELENTQEEIEEMINGEIPLSLDMGRIDTYRDAVGFIASVLGAFATINRFGKLEIRQYHTGIDVVIPDSRRVSSTVYDYKTYFKSVKARFVANGKYEEYISEDEEVTGGLELSLGDVPVIDGPADFSQRVIDNVFTQVELFDYTPTEMDMIPDMSIDLGDFVKLTNINGGTDNSSCIVTGYSWTYHSSMKISSKGGDALLANVQDKQSRQISEIESLIQEKDLIVKTFTNSRDVSFSDRDTTIINMQWSASSEATAVFIATIPVEMSLDGNIIFTCFDSSSEVYRLTKYLSRGKHFVTFSTYVPSPADQMVNFSVKAHCEYFESDSRKQDANIVSFQSWVALHDITENLPTPSVVTTIPSAIIRELTIKASVFAQGLDASTPWDGIINVEERFERFTVNTTHHISVKDFDENVIVNTNVPISRKAITEAFGRMTLSIGTTISVSENLHETVVYAKKFEQTIVTFENTTYTETVNKAIKLKTTYVYNSEEETIDEGFLSSVQIITSDKAVIESVVIE